MTNLFLILAIFLGADLLQEPEKNNEPKRIKITSKRASHNSETQVSILEEKVKVVDGEMVINCHLMTINRNENSEVNLVVAEKDVIITKENAIATGDRAKYFVVEKKVELTGSPEIVQTDPKTGEKNIIKGSKIILYRDKNVVEVEDFHGDLEKEKKKN